MSNVEITCYLIVGVKDIRGSAPNLYVGGRPSVRVSKTKPSLSSREVPLKLTLSLPLSLFQKPDLEATITVPAEKAPFTITPAIQENIAEAIREQTGLGVAITIIQPTE